MAYKITLRLGGGMFDLAVLAKQAVEDRDKDTALRTVCVGDGKVTDPATGEVKDVEKHDPVPPKMSVTCPSCGIVHSSYNGGWHKARDNQDGTFTEVPVEVADAKPGDEYTKTPSLTLHPIEDIVQRTLPSGRFYYLEPGKDTAAKYMAVVGAVRANEARGRAFVTLYAVSSVVSLYRLVVIDNVLALQELAMPEKVRLRPAVNFPAALQAHIDMLVQVGDFAYAPLDPDTYQDEQRKVIAAALAAATPAMGLLVGGTPVATALTARTADPFAPLAAMLASGEKVPHQPLPAEVPENVSVLPEAKPAPRKRAPRKKAAEKVSA